MAHVGQKFALGPRGAHRDVPGCAEFGFHAATGPEFPENEDVDHCQQDREQSRQADGHAQRDREVSPAQRDAFRHLPARVGRHDVDDRAGINDGHPVPACRVARIEHDGSVSLPVFHRVLGGGDPGLHRRLRVGCPRGLRRLARDERGQRGGLGG